MKLNQLFLAALLLISTSFIYAGESDSNTSPVEFPDVPESWYES